MRRTAESSWRTGRCSSAGQALAALALLCQILVVLLPMPGDAATPGALAGAGVICHAANQAPPLDHAPAHHPADCALCPLCLAAALPALAPAAPLVPAPLAQRLAAARPPVRAGPARAKYGLVAQPRGPPASV